MQITDAEALLRAALIHCQEGRFADGVALFRQALAIEPHHGRCHALLARALLELGDAAGALASIDRAIACAGGAGDAYGIRGDVLAQLGRLPEAVDSYRQALRLAPDALPNWCNLGAVQAALGEIAQALASFERAIALAPDHVVALVARADMLRALDRPGEALASYDRACGLEPRQAAALVGRAAALNALGRPNDALMSLDATLALAPADADMLSNRGFLLNALHRFDEAVDSCNRALALDPRHLEALSNRGTALVSLGRYADAIADFERIVAIEPTHAGALANRAKALISANRYREALEGAERLLALDPDHVEALFTRGAALARLRREHEAIAAFERVLALRSGHPHAMAMLASACLAICDFGRADAAERRLVDAIRAGSAVVSPHILLQLSLGGADALKATARYVETEIVSPRQPLPAPRASADGRLRIAYLSGDIRQHPVAHLMAGLLARHDRDRYRIIGVSFGPDDRSEVRDRIVRALDEFHDVRPTGDIEIARRLRDLDVDIAVDLSGHTENGRAGILAQRPAPIQVSYLGLIGTMGADFIDYVIADETALPADQEPFYAERIVQLPGCFMPAEPVPAALAPTPAARAEAGLPAEGFVFCSFNGSYKIREPMFSMWMRLLQAVEGSVLWLLGDSEAAVANLKREAHARGIPADRLVFAPRVSLAQHLARQPLADLFLDTLPYNAGATAIATLQAGVPILTCRGDAFVGRMAASMLSAAGLSELVTESLADYEALAVRLGSDSNLLSSLRAKLARNRATCALFDIERSCRHLEEAYRTMWEIGRRGEAPRSFTVPPAGR